MCMETFQIHKGMLSNKVTLGQVSPDNVNKYLRLPGLTCPKQPYPIAYLSQNEGGGVCLRIPPNPELPEVSDRGCLLCYRHGLTCPTGLPRGVWLHYLSRFVKIYAF